MFENLLARTGIVYGHGRGGALWPVLVLSLGFVGLSFAASTNLLRLTGLAAGLTLIAVILLAALSRLGQRKRGFRQMGALTDLIDRDITPSLICSDSGGVRFRNQSACARFDMSDDLGMITCLKEFVAAPATVMHRLHLRAKAMGSAREDVITRRGHLRLSVTDLGDTGFLWRLEEFSEKAVQGRGPDSFGLPMAIANRAGLVLFSNESLRRLIGARPRRLDQVFFDGPLVAGEEVTLRTIGGRLRAVYAEFEGHGERREIFLLPVPQSRINPGDEPLENVPVALVRFSAEGSVMTANAAARRLLNLTHGHDEMFHTLFEGLGRPVNDWLADVVAARAPARSEVLIQREQSEERYLQVSLNREVHKGRPCAMATILDTTAAKQLEAQVNQGQKMQAVGQLAGGIAHDFNNILTAISGHCDLLLLRHQMHDSDFADLQQIRQNANRAAALVAQLLAFSRKQVLKAENVDVGEVMSDMTHLLNRLLGERHHLRVSHDPEMGLIRADRRQLEQVMMNLVVNARDAMPAGGDIMVRTRGRDLAVPMTRGQAVVPAGKYAEIEVIDPGVGIPADRIDKIFEPFFTTKKLGEGTGLGLATAYGIVKQSGGFIFVRSEEDKGTTFEVFFPIVEAPDLQTIVPVTSQPAPPTHLPGGTVLLVEDEAPVRTFAGRALRLRGYTVIEAASAEEALEKLADENLHIDLFVTDVVMPGLDGPGWVRKALESRPGVGVVFVSGYAEDALSEEQGRIPNSTFLAKPFSLSELAATVQSRLSVH